MKAPSGPRNPKTSTEAARNFEAVKVVHRMRYPQVMPAMTPQSWIAMWAGVQNESRPMERCQAISQCTPITDEVTPRRESQMYQGMDLVWGIGSEFDGKST